MKRGNGETVMEIHGTRFGTLEYDQEEIICLDEGLLGFPMSRRFLLFPYGEGSSFFWLQSVDEPEISFIVVNPFDFFADLEFSIQDEDVQAIGLARSEDVEIFSLVTIPEGHPEEMRTNLAGPVVVNIANRHGRQILLKEYSPRQFLIPEELRGQFVEEAGRERTRQRARQRGLDEGTQVAAGQRKTTSRPIRLAQAG
ncbi:MAG: flagellar assembly protein FliW [Magnetococcales bacterium]|nr:flagellar assembly protein FliW [Magnetococcales bacterium]MBF0156261.1 flagellar assembly protein FliW [Magnetococcales bacterium]